MMMSIALRFIPILLEETDKIMKAQMARGADFEHGNLIQRAKSLVPPAGAAVSSRRSGGPAIWPWPWRRAATGAAKGGRR